MIYFDGAATTKPYKEVADIVYKVSTEYWANPSSNYFIANQAKSLIEDARKQIANDLNCIPENIIFTSGGCEANSLAVMGFLQRNLCYEFYTTKLEHTSITTIADCLFEKVGRITIPNSTTGIVKPQELEHCIRFRQSHSNYKPFVSISAANSEIGVIQDIKMLTKVVHQYGGIIHCDAVQLFPEKTIDVQELGVDMMSVSSQKFHGGRGAGFLYIKDKSIISPIIYGSQEDYIRGGTYNTAAICGMAKALEITRKNNAYNKVKLLRNRLLEQLNIIPRIKLNGPNPNENRLCNNISLTIDGVKADTLVTMCDLLGLVIAKGSACKSYEPTPSEALLAIGLTPEQALSTIRITLDEFNTEEEIDHAADIIIKLVERIREENDSIS